MNTEIEAKFTKVNPREIRKRLINIGAELKKSERLMKRKNFDYPDNRLEKVGGWIRLRDEGDKITLAYKQLNDRSLHGTKEVSVTVSDFEQTANLLLAVGFEMKSYQETKRESWNYKNVDVEIDIWPWIPPFVEIEGEREGLVKTVAKDLGFDWKDAKHGSVENAYQEIFDVTEAEIDSWKEITFSPVPEFIEAKRRG